MLKQNASNVHLLICSFGSLPMRSGNTHHIHTVPLKSCELSHVWIEKVFSVVKLFVISYLVFKFLVYVHHKRVSTKRSHRQLRRLPGIAISSGGCYATSEINKYHMHFNFVGFNVRSFRRSTAIREYFVCEYLNVTVNGHVQLQPIDDVMCN